MEHCMENIRHPVLMPDRFAESPLCFRILQVFDRMRTDVLWYHLHL